MNIVVAVGTHEQQFQRLLDSAAAGLPSLGEMRVQYGVGEWPISRAIVAYPYLTATEMEEWLLWADLSVSQCSPGFVFGALRAGAWPIVLPRLARHGEHVDDHQIDFASIVDAFGLGTPLADAGQLVKEVSKEAQSQSDDRKSRIDLACRGSRDRTQVFLEGFGSIIDRIVS